MSPSPTTLQWTAAFVLLALFSWVLLSLFWDIVPAPWINPGKPQKRIIGIVLLFVMGLLSYSFTREVMVWVWMGIRHLLGLDLEGI
jgi:hypothetical protein